jgi:hypothetical protein
LKDHFPPWGDIPPSVKLSDGVKPWGGSISDVFVLLSVVFSGGIFMVKLERNVDAEAPTKVKNTDIATMNTLMASSITCTIILQHMNI